MHFLAAVINPSHMSNNGPQSRQWNSGTWSPIQNRSWNAAILFPKPHLNPQQQHLSHRSLTIPLTTAPTETSSLMIDVYSLGRGLGIIPLLFCPVNQPMDYALTGWLILERNCPVFVLLMVSDYVVCVFPAHFSLHQIQSNRQNKFKLRSDIPAYGLDRSLNLLPNAPGTGLGPVSSISWSSLHMPLHHRGGEIFTQPIISAMHALTA